MLNHQRHSSTQPTQPPRQQQQPHNVSIWQYRAMPLILLLCIIKTELAPFPYTQSATTATAVPDDNSQDHRTATTANTNSTTNGFPTFTERMTNNSFHGVNARAFPKFVGTSSPPGRVVPCFPPTKSQKLDRKRGLLYLKLHKVGSSTAAGINARIARNEAQRRRRRIRTRQQRLLVSTLPNNATLASSVAALTTITEHIIDFEGSCAAQLAHAEASKMCPQRDKNQSFLWSMVRDPTSRVLSRFFHSHVSLAKQEPTDHAAIRSFCPEGDHYMSRLSTVRITATKRKKRTVKLSEQDRVKYANRIMNEYDFIGVTERMDESAVALSMLLDIPLSDVLYLDGKVTGGYGLEQCIYFVPSFQNPSVEAYFQTPEFQQCTQWDRILHQVANRSLDLTIDETLGRAKFEAKLAKFRSALAFANDYCDDSKVVFSCTSGGVNNYRKKNDCIYKDSGCGCECLDAVAEKLNLDSDS